MQIKKVCMVILLAACGSILIQSCAQNANAERQTTVVKNPTEIQWTSMDDIESLVQTTPKKVIIDVYTDWCKWCKVMDKQTFQNSEVIDVLSPTYHMVKFNAEQKTPITFNGKNYEFVQQGRRGYNQLAAELLQGQLSYPSLIILDENLNTIKVLKGFQSPENLMAALL